MTEVSAEIQSKSEETGKEIQAMSDESLIGMIDLRFTGNISGLPFELQRRFTEPLREAVGKGRVAAWALVIVTAALVFMTGFLAYGTWLLAKR